MNIIILHLSIIIIILYACNYTHEEDNILTFKEESILLIPCITNDRRELSNELKARCSCTLMRYADSNGTGIPDGSVSDFETLSCNGMIVEI